MSNRMSAKLAFMLATGIHLGRRDEPKTCTQDAVSRKVQHQE